MRNERKKPWKQYPKIWKTESAFMSFIRGGIRKALWNRYPIKLEVVKKKRKRIPNPNPRGRVAEVWGGQCYLCKEDFIQGDLQVDHLVGGHSLKTIDDIQAFVEGLLFINEEDLALVCKPCHQAKSHAERKGISFEDAVLEKTAIQIEKELSIDEIKATLEKHGKESGNGVQRREGLIKILRSGKLKYK